MLPRETSTLDTERYMDKKVNGACLRKWKALRQQEKKDRLLTHNFAASANGFHAVTLNGKREVTGVLRGFDQFMNIVLDNCVEITADGTNAAGMVVVRGNSITAMEAAEPL